MSSNPPMALLPSFLVYNHLSDYRAGGSRSWGETGAMRSQKLRGLFQIDARVMESRFVFPWGVFENCNAVPYSEHLSLKDRQTCTAFYFLARFQYNKTLSWLSPSSPSLCLVPLNIPPVEGMELFWRHPNVTHWKSFSGSGLEWKAEPTTGSARAYQFGIGAMLAACFQTQYSAIMWALPLSSVLSLKASYTFPHRLALII